MPWDARTAFWQPTSFVHEGEKQPANQVPTDTCSLNAVGLGSACGLESEEEMLTMLFFFPPDTDSSTCYGDFSGCQKTPGSAAAL